MVAPFTPMGSFSESSTMMRARLNPWRPWGRPTPQYSSSTCAGSISGLRSSSASTTKAPISSGRSWASEPLKARPMGVRTASTITGEGMARTLLRRHPEGAVEPQHLAVQHRVLGDVAGELRVLLRAAQARRGRDRRAPRVARVLGGGGQQGRVEQPPRDRAEPDAEPGEGPRPGE